MFLWKKQKNPRFLFAIEQKNPQILADQFVIEYILNLAYLS